MRNNRLDPQLARAQAEEAARNAGSGSGSASGSAAPPEDTRPRRPPPPPAADVRAPEPLPEPTLDKHGNPLPYTGRLAGVMNQLAKGRVDPALGEARRWRAEAPGDVLALIALGEALEAKQQLANAARAYGSIIDLFPARADLRRFAGERLDRLAAAKDAAAARELAVDTYQRAVEQRPDHLTGHRLLAYALLRAGRPAEAFAAIEVGLAQQYPGGRFRGGEEILREDLGLIGAAWKLADPRVETDMLARLKTAGVTLPEAPSTRFVLVWETDANDVDFHIRDDKGGHAYYSSMTLPSGGRLYEDVTTGYGPECFTIEGKPTAAPYDLSIHFYSRGPMGYGMGKLQVLRHDGKGALTFEDRPFVVMTDNAFVELGSVK
jgi:hypothetical protein